MIQQQSIWKISWLHIRRIQNVEYLRHGLLYGIMMARHLHSHLILSEQLYMRLVKSVIDERVVLAPGWIHSVMQEAFDVLKYEVYLT